MSGRMGTAEAVAYLGIRSGSFANPVARASPSFPLRAAIPSVVARSSMPKLWSDGPGLLLLTYHNPVCFCIDDRILLLEKRGEKRKSVC